MGTRSCRDERQTASIIVRSSLAACDADAVGGTCYYGDKAAAAAAAAGNWRRESDDTHDFHASADW